MIAIILQFNLQDKFASDLDMVMNLIAWVGILILLILIFIQGIKFIKQSQEFKEASKAQATYYRGIGMFMISIGISQGVYLFDFISEILFGARIFARSPYEFASLVDRDYYVAIYFALLFSSAFLIYPLERYMLGRKKSILTVITIVIIPMPITLRVLEYLLGVNLTADSLLYLIFTTLWYAVVILLVVIVATLIYMYLQVGIKAPKGSVLMKKSIQIILGFALWLAAVFTTSMLLKEIEFIEEDLYKVVLPFVIPIILGIALKLIISGYSKDL